MKVYLLVEDWRSNDIGDVDVSAYSTREMAENALSLRKKEVMELFNYDTIDYMDKDYFDYYIDGEYDNEHIHLRIEEHNILEGE